MTERERLIEILNKYFEVRDDDFYRGWLMNGAETIADYLLASGVIVPPCLSDDLTSMVRKVVVQMSNDIENLIVDEIIKTAQREGITDIYVLSKPNIISAIRKQIAVKPDIEGDGYDDKGELIYDTGYCPTCRHVFEIDYDTSEHCPKCGQALDWSDVQC